MPRVKPLFYTKNFPNANAIVVKRRNDKPFEQDEDQAHFYYSSKTKTIAKQQAKRFCNEMIELLKTITKRK